MTRLAYLGGATSPSVGAAVQAAILVGALSLAFGLPRVGGLPRVAEQAGWPARPAILWPSLAVIGVGLALTQGRGPILAVLAACAVLLAAQRRWRVLALLLLLSLAGAGLLAAWAPEVVFRVSADIRLTIWQAFAARIAERPWVGHGVGDLSRVVVPAAFAGLGAYGPHSLFVGVAFHGGLVGLGLFLVLLAMAAASAWRAAPASLALVAFVVVNGATDFGRMVEPLGPTWFILWLPLGAIMGAVMGAVLAATPDGRYRTRRAAGT